MQGVVHILP